MYCLVTLITEMVPKFTIELYENFILIANEFYRFSGKDIPVFTDNLKMNDRIRFSCSSNGTERTAIHRVTF